MQGLIKLQGFLGRVVKKTTHPAGTPPMEGNFKQWPFFINPK
jgi:hypothetical protein